MNTTMALPKLTEAGDSLVITEWTVNVGDRIQADDPVLFVETEKVAVEVCSTVTGRITQLYVQKGDVVQPGQPILEVE